MHTSLGARRPAVSSSHKIAFKSHTHAKDTIRACVCLRPVSMRQALDGGVQLPWIHGRWQVILGDGCSLYMHNFCSTKAFDFFTRELIFIELQVRFLKPIVVYSPPVHEHVIRTDQVDQAAWFVCGLVVVELTSVLREVFPDCSCLPCQSLCLRTNFVFRGRFSG